MWYVYILQSQTCPQKFYTGFTADLKRRFSEHNAIGNDGHTSKYQPWLLHSYFAFSDKKTAYNFEAYLKTQAGRRFQKRRFKITDVMD
jgi:predicted GIY-YIG superfamily endonuclease